MKMSHDCASIITYNEKSDSILLKYDKDDYNLEQSVLEYARGKLLVTGYFSQAYLIENFDTIKVINETNPNNDKKTDAFLMPQFDEKKFPFIVVCGK